MSAPAGDVKGVSQDLIAWGSEIDERPLAITNGDTDMEPSGLALLPPSGLSSGLGRLPRTAGKQRPRNTTSMGQQRHNSLNLHATKGRREGGGNRTALGKIEQGKYITESDLQHDFNKTQDVERKHRLESANYQIFSGDAADI